MSGAARPGRATGMETRMPSLITRRSFLERTALTGAAAAFAPRWLADAQASGMFVSLNGAVAPRVGPWPAVAELASKIGYGGIDSPNLNALKMLGVDGARAFFANLKLQPTITGGPTLTGQQPAFEASLPAFEENVKFWSEIGGTRMMTVMGANVPPNMNMTFAEFRALYKSRLTTVNDILKKYNVRLGLEFLGPQCMRFGTCGGGNRGRGAAAPAAGTPAPPAAAGAAPAPQAAPPTPPAAPAAPPALPVPGTPFIYNLPETVKLAMEAGSNIGAVCDVWHWHHSGSTAQDILNCDRSRIVHIHMSDARAMPPEEVRDNMRLMPGEGIIDYVAFFGALKRIGYTGGVAPEPLGPRITPEMTTEEAAKLGYDTTLAMMKRGGVA